MEKSTLAAFFLGAALAGTTATLAGTEDAAAKFRELAPNAVAHRVDLSVADDGSIRAALHFHGALTDDAKAAGVERPAWVVDVVCQPDAVQAALAACPVVDEAAVPLAFRRAR